MDWYVTKNIRRAVPTEEIPCWPYARFYTETTEKLIEGERYHCALYFGVPAADGRGLIFYVLLADDATGEVLLASWKYGYYDEEEVPSLTARFPAMHPFEREITEQFGIRFSGHPFDKPLRFAQDRADRGLSLNNYPFWRADDPSLHEVNVGPIHAGIIEPGVFRFVCNGERIVHLEIVLGFQHRGVERLMRETGNRLRQTTLAETIAGDSAVSHAAAFCQVAEGFAGWRCGALDAERAVAAEMERMAMHMADTGALCMDTGYQLGQVACEALRTMTINTTQRWCGNRFGKGLIRPFGTRFPLTPEKRELMAGNVTDIRRRYEEAGQDIFTSPSVLARFEDCGTVTRQQMIRIGAVGMAARSAGLKRDVRYTHPYGAYAETVEHNPVVLEQGDVMARAMLRYREALQSADSVLALLGREPETDLPEPDFGRRWPGNALSFVLTEGWRGEICHAAVTGPDGEVLAYKIKDPSLHNWYALSLAVRGAGISDFPVCNKSFDLSYCGHDL